MVSWRDDAGLEAGTIRASSGRALISTAAQARQTRPQISSHVKVAGAPLEAIGWWQTSAALIRHHPEWAPIRTAARSDPEGQAITSDFQQPGPEAI